MCGLFLYYLSLSKKAALFSMFGAIIVIAVGWMESAQKLVIFYLSALPLLALIYTGGTGQKNDIVEKLIPFSSKKIVFAKYLLFLFSQFTISFLAIFYAKIVSEMLPTGESLENLLVFHDFCRSVCLLMGTAMLMMSCSDRTWADRRKTVFFLAAESVVIYFALGSERLLALIRLNTDQKSNGILFFSVMMFFVASYPISVLFQKNKVLL